VGVEENTNRAFVADTDIAATLMSTSGTGTSLFVINLCASMTPIANIGKSLPGLEAYRLYQVTRREDGRTRYRLRLGFFTSETAAEAILSNVREAYPTAFATCLCDEDQKFARGFVCEPRSTSKMAVVDNEAAVTPATAPPKPAPQAKPEPAVEIELSWDPPAQPEPKKQQIQAPSKLRAAIELTLEAEHAPATKSETAHAPSTEPFRVSRGAEIPATPLTLETAPVAKVPAPQTPVAALASKPAKPIAPAASSAPAKPATEIARPKALQANAPAAKAVAMPTTVTPKPVGKLPDLDSTQTIRALTSAELENESQEKWFAIQLAASDQPVNLDAMPRLDIFEAYRLYSVASAANGKITHSLRIGFFREEVSAEAVSGYLKTFFASPTVVRISIAEHARFKDAPAPKPAPKADVLDLNHARDRAPKTVPTVTMEVETPRFDPNATGSFRSATGTYQSPITGTHKALTSTGSYRALGATGTNKVLKAASKTAAPPTKRSAPLSKMSSTGKHKSLQPKKSLAEQLLDEAREVELSESGIRKLPKNDSLLSKMLGRLTK
jgi:hypothetical protein